MDDKLMIHMIFIRCSSGLLFEIPLNNNYQYGYMKEFQTMFDSLNFFHLSIPFLEKSQTIYFMWSENPSLYDDIRKIRGAIPVVYPQIVIVCKEKMMPDRIRILANAGADDFINLIGDETTVANHITTHIAEAIDRIDYLHQKGPFAAVQKAEKAYLNKAWSSDLLDITHAHLYLIYKKAAQVQNQPLPKAVEELTLEDLAKRLSNESGVLLTLRPKATILTVDDEADVRERLSDVFGDTFVIVEAKDAMEGLMVLQNQAIDVVLLDIMMPDVKNSFLPDGSGLTMLPFIKKIQPSTEVLMMTGYQHQELILSAFDKGAFDYFDKSTDMIEPGAVLDKIHQAADRKYYTELFARQLAALEKKLLGDTSFRFEFDETKFGIHPLQELSSSQQ